MLAVALLGVFAISLPNLLDPMIRHDDYPAYFADPKGFWDKTLHEGRWINYIWHLRELVTPAWLNFAVYQSFWACFAAAVAVAAIGRQGVNWFTGALTLMIVVAPPATLISLWFNTLLPGLGLVALFAVLSITVSPAMQRALLPVFVVFTFMAYTTYPLLLLVVCLVRAEQRSVMDLARLLGLFILSFAAAVLLTYAINWQVHGIFGVPLAEWREANPAESFAELQGNLPLVFVSISNFLMKSSFDFLPAAIFHVLLLGCATWVMLRRARLEALYLHAGLWMGMALVAVQVLKLGITVPPRAFIFAWVFYAVVVVRAAALLSSRAGFSGRMARNFVVLIVASYLLQTGQQYMAYRAWQADTKAIAEVVSTANSSDIYLVGDPSQFKTARDAHVQTGSALVFRIQQLADLDIIWCREKPDTCRAMPKANPVHEVTKGEVTFRQYPSAMVIDLSMKGM